MNRFIVALVSYLHTVWLHRDTKKQLAKKKAAFVRIVLRLAKEEQSERRGRRLIPRVLKVGGG